MPGSLCAQSASPDQNELVNDPLVIYSVSGLMYNQKATPAARRTNPLTKDCTAPSLRVLLAATAVDASTLEMLSRM